MSLATFHGVPSWFNVAFSFLDTSDALWTDVMTWMAHAPAIPKSSLGLSIVNASDDCILVASNVTKYDNVGA